MNTQPNTFYSLLDITEYINMKLDEGYKTYLYEEELENTEDNIEEFLMEYTNSDTSIYLYDFTNLTQRCCIECVSYIRDEYFDMTGEKMNDMPYNRQNLEPHLIYFVGQEWSSDQITEEIREKVRKNTERYREELREEHKEDMRQELCWSILERRLDKKLEKK
tara:strand:+ start:86 stop:574 length:489 start_codon:yes stop_codon:yes gene_type:complete